MPARKQNWNTFLTGIVLAVHLWASLFIGEVKGGDMPFGATIGMDNVGKEKKVAKGKLFGFVFCLNAFETSIENIKMSLSLPEEIQKLDGEPVREGYLDPEKKMCLNVSLKSRTEMEQWSQPIHAHMQFVHEGMGFARDVKWRSYTRKLWIEVKEKAA